MKMKILSTQLLTQPLMSFLMGSLLQIKMSLLGQILIGLLRQIMNQMKTLTMQQLDCCLQQHFHYYWQEPRKSSKSRWKKTDSDHY
jgi:hypothetical protein